MQQPDPRVDRLLAMREWQVFECKRANLHPSQALVPIVALANAEGGVFVLGLEDPDKADGTARLIGVSEHLDNEEELLNLVPKTITPPIPALLYEEVPIVNHRGQADHLLMFIVPKSPDVHSTLYGDAYLRRGRTNRRLTAAEILQLKYAKGAWHVEDEPVPNVTLDDLDRDLLDEYMEAVAAREPDVMTFFRSNGLTAISEDKPVLTRAAVLLFGMNPAIMLRAKCGIKLSTFRGAEAHPSLAGKPISIEGPLSRQIWECVEYLKRWRDGTPALRYPDYALQEAITNAVIHRDYAVQNDIQVRLFDDRVEVESPGRLAGHVTLAAIRHERFARNPIILRTLNRFPQAPNLDIGDGVKRLFDAMRQAGLADPVYEAPADRSAVRLILYNHLRDSLWDQVAQWLDHYGTVTNHDVRQLTGMEDRVRVSRLLHSWVERGLLVSRGTGKRDRHYMRPTDAQPSLFS